MPMAGLPLWRATVCVGPPWSSSPAGSRSGFLPVTELLPDKMPVGAVWKKQLVAFTLPAKSAATGAEFPPKRLSFATTAPPTGTPPPAKVPVPRPVGHGVQNDRTVTDCQHATADEKAAADADATTTLLTGVPHRPSLPVRSGVAVSPLRGTAAPGSTMADDDRRYHNWAGCSSRSRSTTES